MIVCLQAGNVHSGAFDPLAEAIDVAHRHGAWVHVDGAFGLWAAAAPALRHLVAGLAAANSWATDAHKTLNVPYDCGVAIVADRAAMRSVFGAHAPATSSPMTPDPVIPSRKFPSTLGARVVSPCGRPSAHLAGQASSTSSKAWQATLARWRTVSPRSTAREVVNEVVYTQVCVAFGDDQRTRAVTAHLIADGTAWMSGSRWHDRDVLRVSVSNWSTDDEDVRRSVEAVRRAVAATGGSS